MIFVDDGFWKDATGGGGSPPGSLEARVRDGGGPTGL